MRPLENIRLVKSLWKSIRARAKLTCVKLAPLVILFLGAGFENSTTLAIPDFHSCQSP